MLLSPVCRAQISEVSSQVSHQRYAASNNRFCCSLVCNWSAAATQVNDQISLRGRHTGCSREPYHYNNLKGESCLPNVQVDICTALALTRYCGALRHHRMFNLPSELEGVLGHVVIALEHEDNNESFGAVSSYHRAKAQLEYVIELLGDSDHPSVRELCKTFIATYQQRISVSLHTEEQVAQQLLAAGASSWPYTRMALLRRVEALTRVWGSHVMQTIAICKSTATDLMGTASPTDAYIFQLEHSSCSW
jgi:hypothetical protein